MQIAQVLAGYTLGGADLLRRAMGKKKAERMAKQREVFVTGATERGVEEQRATRIFDLMEKFAGYGFNKSHSAAYGTSVLPDGVSQGTLPCGVYVGGDECGYRQHRQAGGHQGRLPAAKLALNPPSVNRSAYQFSVAGERGILYGLGAIKGVGRAAIEAIIAERDANGAFSTLTEFCRRVDLEKINRRALEAMIKAGAFDDFNISRRGLINGLPDAIQTAEQEARARAAGQNDMFGLTEPEVGPR